MRYQPGAVLKGCSGIRLLTGLFTPTGKVDFCPNLWPFTWFWAKKLNSFSSCSTLRILQMSKEVNWESCFWLIKNLHSSVNQVWGNLLMLLYVYFSSHHWGHLFEGSSLSEDTGGRQSQRKSCKLVKGFHLFYTNKKFTRQGHISQRKGKSL